MCLKQVVGFGAGVRVPAGHVTAGAGRPHDAARPRTAAAGGWGTRLPALKPCLRRQAARYDLGVMWLRHNRLPA